MRELYQLHKIKREDLYKHLCVANSLHTGYVSGLHIGIYGIGRKWWCSEDGDAPGGSCNVKCSDLLDNDIADDVRCAELILSQQGVLAWVGSESTCFSKRLLVDKCLEEIDDESETTTLTPENTSSVKTNTSTTTPSKTTTSSPGVTSATTSVSIYTTLTSRRISTTTPTEKLPSNRHKPNNSSSFFLSMTTTARFLAQEQPECSNRFLYIFITVMAIVFIILITIKYEKNIRLNYRGYRYAVRFQNEYENSPV